MNINEIVQLSVNDIAMRFKKCDRFELIVLISELYLQTSALILAVMNNANVLDIDIVNSKERCNCGKDAGLIGNINMNGIYLFDRSA